MQLNTDTYRTSANAQPAYARCASNLEEKKLKEVYVVFFGPHTDWRSRLVAFYLHNVLGHKKSATHVGLCLVFEDGSTDILEVTTEDVYYYPIEKYEDNFGKLREMQFMFKVPYFSQGWITEALIHLGAVNFRLHTSDVLRYPWRRGTVCTGVVQHLLLRQVTNPTPLEFYDELNSWRREYGER